MRHSKGECHQSYLDAMRKTRIRRRRSMQIMNASTLFCGLDVHRNGLSYAAIVDQMGKLIKSTTVPDDSLLVFLERYHPAKVAMEASTAITPIYRELTKHGYDVFVSHPTKTMLIAESRIKTDRVDARALAELLRLDALPSSYMPDEEISSLREMVRRRAYLVRERTKFRVKIRDCLVYNGIKRKDGSEGSSKGLFTIDGVNWLQSLNLEPISMYLRLIQALDREINVLSNELKEKASDNEDVKLLTTIPGVGYYSALLIKSEIGEIDRFPSGEKLCSYAGLVPSIRSSGSRARYGSITKQGSKWLWWIMVEAAVSHATKNDTTISRFYHSIAQRKGKQIAAVATARKLLLCCYSVLKNRRSYYDQAILE
jgi:transposase